MLGNGMYTEKHSYSPKTMSASFASPSVIINLLLQNGFPFSFLEMCTRWCACVCVCVRRYLQKCSKNMWKSEKVLYFVYIFLFYAVCAFPCGSAAAAVKPSCCLQNIKYVCGVRYKHSSSSSSNGTVPFNFTIAINVFVNSSNARNTNETNRVCVLRKHK